MKKYEGVIPALATPFRKDEAIDEEGLPKLVGCHICAGVQGVCVL